MRRPERLPRVVTGRPIGRSPITTRRPRRPRRRVFTTASFCACTLDFTRISGSGLNGIPASAAGGPVVAGPDRYSGTSGNLGIALGGIVAPNLALYGAFFASIVDRADVSEGGISLGQSAGTAGIFALGAGVAYYIQPSNFYVSGTLAGVQFELSNANGDPVYDSKFGLGFQGMAGKEWWVSPEWGLGIAGQFIAASMKDKNNSDVTWTATSFSLVFSATYN